jgi:hypothetical protein
VVFAFLQEVFAKSGAFAWFFDGEFVVERAELWVLTHVFQ